MQARYVVLVLRSSGTAGETQFQRLPIWLRDPTNYEHTFTVNPFSAAVYNNIEDAKAAIERLDNLEGADANDGFWKEHTVIVRQSQTGSSEEEENKEPDGPSTSSTP